MQQEQLERYGNDLTISGLVIGNDLYQEVLMFPNEAYKPQNILSPTTEDLHAIFQQLDTLQITGAPKITLRKSQRNIEQGVSWAVFRRDNFTCRYCGADDVPMTVDHVVRWENLGESVEENLICACRKCNKTRGNIEYPDWLNHPYYLERINKLPGECHVKNVKAWDLAIKVPLRNHKRSR